MPRVVLCLGAIAWTAAIAALRGLDGVPGFAIPTPRPKFGHGAEHDLGAAHLLGCYHVSQQNTFTGRLTPAMIDSVLRRAIDLATRSAP